MQLPLPYPLKKILLETTRLVNTHLWAKIIFFLILGLGVGFLIGPQANLVSVEHSRIISSWLVLPGKIFLVLMQMIILPLVMSSVILGILSAGSLDLLKKISMRLIPYFIITTVVSTLIGFSVSELMRPGDKISKEALPGVEGNKEIQAEVVEDEPIPQMITSYLPKNPLSAMVEGHLFQVVIFAIIIGIALLSMSAEDSSPMVNLITSIQVLSMTIVGRTMSLAPIAVFGLMSDLLAKVGFDALLGIGTYVMSVLMALLGVLCFYMLIIFLGAKRNPFSFLKAIKDVQLLAFSTSSSAAVMPLTLETAEKKLGISPSISRFVIPIGTTINMDGTATYQGVAACFIAQAYGLDLSMSQIMMIVVSATFASIGAPGTPGVGMIILGSILKSVGVPVEGILLLMGVDRILDMFRTVINVTGDLTASLFFNRWI